MERKKIGQIQGRISRRRLVRNPTIQYIIINLLTKYDYSSLHSFTEIFDEKFHHSKYGKKENWTNTGKNKQEKAEGWFAIPRYSMSSSTFIPNMSLLACKVVEKSLTKKCYGRTEGRTDGRTDRCKPVYPPLFQSGGIIRNVCCQLKCMEILQHILAQTALKFCISHFAKIWSISQDGNYR